MALNRMNAQDREMILMRYYEGLGNSEVAAILGISASAAGKRFGRALRRLHKLSHGIPRVINVLCNKALMLSYASGDYYVTGRHIDAAAADSELQ